MCTPPWRKHSALLDKSIYFGLIKSFLVNLWAKENQISYQYLSKVLYPVKFNSRRGIPTRNLVQILARSRHPNSDRPALYYMKYTDMCPSWCWLTIENLMCAPGLDDTTWWTFPLIRTFPILCLKEGRVVIFTTPLETKTWDTGNLSRASLDVDSFCMKSPHCPSTSTSTSTIDIATNRLVRYCYNT